MPPAPGGGRGRPPYEDAVAAIEAGRIAPVYLLAGPSHLAARAVRDALLDACVEPGRRELDAPVVAAGALAWAALVEILRTPSWSGGRRVVTLDEPRGLAAARRGRGGDEEEPGEGEAGVEAGPGYGDDASVFESYLDAPSPDVTVLLRTRAPADRRRRLIKRIEAMGGFVDCRQPGDRLNRRAAPAEAEAWLIRRAAAAGRTFVPGLAAGVVARVGPDLDLLDRELEKMLLYSPEATLGADAMEVVSGQAEEDIFKLIDAIGDREPARVHLELGRLWDRGESALGVLALLGSQIRIMRAGADLARAGRRPAEIASALAANPYRVERALLQARPFTAADLDRALEAAWLAEWRVKSGQWPEREAVEWTVATLVGAGENRPTPPSSPSSGASSSSARRRPARHAPS